MMPMIRAVAEGESAEAWAQALRGDWRPRAEAIKREGATAVLRTRLRERNVVIKTWRLTPRRRVQSTLMLSPAWRHWRAARRLRRDGFTAAQPIAIATIEMDRSHAEALVLEALEGPTVLESLARPMTLRQEAPLARAVGAQVGQLARAGWYNRDHKPSNLIVTRADAHGAEVALIDCVGFRRIKPGSEEFLARMLAKLAIEALGCGVLPRATVGWRVLSAAAGDDRVTRRQLWGRVQRLVNEHGDPAPRVNPLGRPPVKAATPPAAPGPGAPPSPPSGPPPGAE